MLISHARQINSLILRLSLKYLKISTWKNDYLFIMPLLVISLQFIQRDSAQDHTYHATRGKKKKRIKKSYKKITVS